MSNVSTAERKGNVGRQALERELSTEFSWVVNMELAFLWQTETSLDVFSNNAWVTDQQSELGPQSR